MCWRGVGWGWPSGQRVQQILQEEVWVCDFSEETCKTNRKSSFISTSELPPGQKVISKVELHQLGGRRFLLFLKFIQILKCFDNQIVVKLTRCVYTDLQHQRTLTRTRRAWVHPGRTGARALRPRRWACRCDGHILPARRTSPPLCCWWVLSVRPKRRQWQRGQL